jgi:lysozyme
MTRPINAAGLSLVKSFESFSAVPYQDEGGIWTIGYGHTSGVNANTPPVTEEQAAEQLADDLAEFGGYVTEYITETISDNEYAALVSLTENVGTGPLVDGLGEVLNQGDHAAASDHFLLWNKETIDGELVVVPGLTRRRAAEKALFLMPDDEPATHNID